MIVRALIFAVESYPDAEGGVAKELPGSLQAGLDFRDWLVAKCQKEGDDLQQLIFCSSPQQPDGRKARAQDLLVALDEIRLAGRDQTERLFVFFSGHGFSFVESALNPADVIMTADFTLARFSAHCCHNLDALVSWFRWHLGPGHHYYFIDACRNALDANKIGIATPPPYDRSGSAEASTFVLHSTVEGAVAAANGTFPRVLLEGLNGKEKAKVWDDTINDAMVVKYESLRRYLKNQIPTQAIASSVNGPDGEGDAVLAVLKPIPECTCTITIEGADATEAGQRVVKRGRGTAGQPEAFVGQPAPLVVEPDKYTLAIELDDGTLEPAEPQVVDIYEDTTVTFKKVDAPAPAVVIRPFESMGTADLGILDVQVPAAGEVTFLNVDSGETHIAATSARMSLPHGRYRATLRGRSDRMVIREMDLDLEAGDAMPVAIHRPERRSAPQESIARLLPEDNERSPDFSESLLGTLVGPDLDVWLALIGAGRILGSQGQYHKLAQFPLHDFHDERPGAAPVYVLAGLDASVHQLEVSVSPTSVSHWRSSHVAALGLQEAYVPNDSPGQQLVSVRVNDGPSYTIASLAMPNRATLITCSLEDDGAFSLSQYLLPLAHLVPHMPQRVQDLLDARNHLDDVRYIAQACRAFRQRHSLYNETNLEMLQDMLYQKWLDPIAAAMASYELIRRGRKDTLRELVTNMNTFFADLPDTACLTRFAGDDAACPDAPPLFFDGLRAFPELMDRLPLPASHLDFNSPWTAWRAVVD